MANSQILKLKALSNKCFLLILLNKKIENNKRLEKKGIKLGTTFFKNSFWIILLYWPIFYLFTINVDIYKENYIKNGKKYNANIKNKNKKINNLGININIVNINKKANNSGINIAIKNKKVDT